MQKDNTKVNIDEVLDIKELEGLLKYFYAFTKLNVMVVSTKGKELLFCGDNTSFCKGKKKNCKICEENLGYGGKKSEQLGEPYIYSCGCGLIMCSSPIIYKDKLIGSIVCGPTVLWDVDDFAVSELKEKSKNIFQDELHVSEAIKSIQSLSCVNMTGAAKLLFLIANYMCEQKNKLLSKNAEIATQQAQINELICEKNENTNDCHAKANPNDKTDLGRCYPLRQEKELIAFVQLGDKQKATKMLNEVLSEILLYSASDLECMRARLYELSAFLSRAAVESGAPLNEVNPIIKKSVKIMDDSTGYEEMCHVISEVLSNLIDAVYTNRGRKPSSQHLTNAIAFIKENYAYDISLDEVAKGVYVSVYYLSHLFRSEMNTTFSDYLNSVRMEESKKLLKETNLSIAEIGERVGYNDSNYFAKIFKKAVGVTPKQYSTVFVRTENK